jgi:hypothetical protein
MGEGGEEENENENEWSVWGEITLNKCLITHKYFRGALNRHFYQTRFKASVSCRPSLQTIVSIDFTCH